MKRKTINKILNGKFHLWKESIDDEKVKRLVEQNTIISGGCIVSLLLNEEVNDFDIYFRDLETTVAVAEYYINQYRHDKDSTYQNGITKDICIVVDNGRVKIKVKSSGVTSVSESDNYHYFEGLDPGSPEQEEFIDNAFMVEKNKNAKKGEYKPVFITSNSIMLSSSVQLIFRFYGDVNEIHKNYDFVHCTSYWTSWEQKLVLRAEALESILTKELRYSGSLYPLTSIIRTRKFIKRGWSINAGQYLKMAMQLNDLNLKDITVLEDQLIGVDVAYFQDLINRIKNNDEKVDSIYISELIDEIF